MTVNKKKILCVLKSNEFIYNKWKKWVAWLFKAQFSNNFSELLLWEINVLDIFNVVIFKDLFVLRSAY